MNKLIALIIMATGCAMHEPYTCSIGSMCIYADEFKALALERGIDIVDMDTKLVFSDGLIYRNGSAHQGYCDIKNEPFKTSKLVVLFKGALNLSEDEQRFLVYHELGHCWLNRGHNEVMQEYRLNEYTTCSARASIMHSRVTPMSGCMQALLAGDGYQMFINELFSEMR